MRIVWITVAGMSRKPMSGSGSPGDPKHAGTGKYPCYFLGAENKRFGSQKYTVVLKCRPSK